MDRIIKQFQVVAESKNLNKASKILNISQPALTKSIKKLEEYYNVEFFERHSRGMALTKFGQLFLKYCNTIEQQYSLAERELKALNASKEGHIVIGCGITYSSLVTPILQKIYDLYPNVSISLVSRDQEEMLDGILSSKIDFVLASIDFFDGTTTNVKKQHIMDIDYCILVRPEHPLAQKQNVQISDITQYPWLEFTQSKDRTVKMNEFLLKRGHPALNIALESDFLRVLSRILHDDNYLILSPKAIIENEFNAVPLDIELPFLSISTGVFYLSSSYKIPYIRMVLQLMMETLKETHKK